MEIEERSWPSLISDLTLSVLPIPYFGERASNRIHHYLPPCDSKESEDRKGFMGKLEAFFEKHESAINRSIVYTTWTSLTVNLLAYFYR